MTSFKIKYFLLLFAVVAFIGLIGERANAQATTFKTINKVDVNLVFPEYDVMYIADLVDIRSQQINPNISGFSITLNVTNPIVGIGNVSIHVQARYKLRGDNTYSIVADGTTNLFSLTAGTAKTLSARDFSKSTSDIYIKTYNTNMSNGNGGTIQDAQNRLTNFATSIPTVPPGIYEVSIQILNDQSVPVGGATQSITIANSTPDEVVVDINDPRDGSFLNNLAPTFSWTSQKSDVIVSVYEAGINNRSAQDALTGSNPCLVKEVIGASTLTYPPDASRKLQQDRAYVLQVSAKVTTDRGENDRPSKPVVFRISDDRVGKMLDNYLNAAGGNAAATYSTLRSDPSNWIAWQQYGKMTIDGLVMTETDLQTLLNILTTDQDAKVSVSIENR